MSTYAPAVSRGHRRVAHDVALRLGPLAVVAAILTVGFLIVVSRLLAPSDGTVVLLSERLPGKELRIAGVLEPRSGLKAGDLVIALDGVPVTRGDPRPVPQVDDVVVYNVIRDGASVAVPVLLTAWPARAWAAQNWAALVLGVCLLAIGGFVFHRRPHDPAARTLVVTCALEAVGVLSYVLGGQVMDLVDRRGLIWLALGELCLAALWAAWLGLMLRFPSPLHGVPIGRSTIACGAILIATYGTYLLVVLPSPSGKVVTEWRLIAVSFLPGFVMPPLIVVGVLAQWRAVRRRGDRRFLLHVLASFALCGVLFCALWQLPVLTTGTPLVRWELVPLIGLPCAITLAAAVLRFGLFDVKAVAGRSMVYTSLTVAVVGGYVVIVVSFGALVTAGPILAPQLVAVVVLALLVAPLKDRLQRAVSRMLYGSRDEPYSALARLGQHLESAAVAGAVLPSVVDTVSSALRLPYAMVELWAADETVLRRAEIGEPSGATVSLPAAIGGQLVGRLVVVPRTGDEFSDAELRLLTDLTRQAAPALRALQLTFDLQISRQRIVLARAEERRRLQRDLHDGIGPSLAGLALQLGAARNALGAGHPTQASAALTEIERQLVECGSDLRRLLVGLRFPLLDSLGLAGALEHQARRLGPDGGLDIRVDVPVDLDTMPAAVEEVALAIASEAMTNAARHAAARRCIVSLRVNDVLALRVIDDGCGIATDRSAGIGLPSMAQRAEELGGEVTVRAVPSGGTEVSALIPLVAP